MTYNPQKRNAQILLVAAMFLTAGIFVPNVVGIDGFDGGYAISLFSLLAALTAGIAAGFCFQSARQLDRILHGKDILAHWTYTQQQWRTYSQIEYATENSEKRALFFVVVVFALAFGVLFWALDTEAGFYVFLTMLGVIGVVGFAWRFTVWLNYRQNMTRIGEAYITPDGVYLNGKMYSWRAPLTHFESAKLERNRDVAVVVFRYSVFTGRAGNQTYTVRVPVPEGQELDAEEVVHQVSHKNQ